MTVIAYRDGVIACDGRLTIADLILSDSIKKIAKGVGVIGGFAGDAEGMGENLRWLTETNADWVQLPKNKASGIVVFDRRELTGGFQIFMVEEGSYYEAPDGVYARGSGRETAMALLTEGYSPKDVVRISSKLITTCGGKIFVEKL